MLAVVYIQSVFASVCYDLNEIVKMASNAHPDKIGQMMKSGNDDSAAQSFPFHF